MPDPIPALSSRSSLERPEETILSVERAFRIVEFLADQADGLSLAEIARRLDVNKAIAVKLLGTLEHLGFVWRDDVLQRYWLTYRISNLGLRQLQQSRLLDQCAPLLKNLAETTGELVRLAVVENAERITWVYAIAGAQRSVRIDPNYTLEIVLNAHAIAKAWLMTLPFERAWELVAQQGVRACTVKTKTDREAVRAELREAAARGFATSYEEQELGVGAIAAPIVVPTLEGAHGCVGAVSLAAPTNRMTRPEIEACAPMLLDTVERLARIWPLESRTQRPIIRRL